MIEYNNELYNDDRLYVLSVVKCTKEENNKQIITTVYYADPPDEYEWCLLTLHNVPRYGAVKVDYFDSKEAAEDYAFVWEPTVPLISLGGRAPYPIPTYREFSKWKKDQGLEEYDYKKMFLNGAKDNPREIIYQDK